jgi:hypothetical protein
MKEPLLSGALIGLRTKGRLLALPSILGMGKGRDNDKRSSLLGYGNNYGSGKFYSTGLRAQRYKTFFAVS